ncbi:Phospholipase B1, membrane-associated-like [Oopsacas minuta]|uniref:Phospholipase B1, membrane-associated n=1 Tax=Oopsacas minuta TaxID=111878 RepID=A0AAV7JYU9_9METZ|nr:Phospholipase B1, membrane-associated-like [Oopsacas minuta]
MMKVLIFIYFLLAILSIVNCVDESAPIYISSLNEDSDPDDNITEVTSVYAVQFTCNVLQISALSPANNVHELRPTDVGVVGAIGDSMTAALFAKVSGVLGLLPGLLDKHKLEYRGVSWSIGGDNGVTTLPNFIKNYNPDLKGYSVGTGKEGTTNAAYNFAVSGAVASDLLGQAQLLVNRIKSDNRDDEWKVITLFIGGNDLCAICNSVADKVTYSADNFYNHIMKAINKLSELKKVFINLVQTVEVSKVSLLTKNFGCLILQGIMDLFGKCSCINDNGITGYHDEYKIKIHELETHFRHEFDHRDDIVVVVQPFFGITNIPEVDSTSYFAPDCFHLSQKGLLHASVALWNNMLEPVGSKTKEFLVDQQVLCPRIDNPYFYTHKNSPSLSTNNLGPKPNDADNSLSSGQTVGVVIGTLLLVAAAVCVVVGGAIGLYFKYRKPRFSQYISLSKAAKV